MAGGSAKGPVTGEAVRHSPWKGRSSPASAQHRATPEGHRLRPSPSHFSALAADCTARKPGDQEPQVWAELWAHAARLGTKPPGPQHRFGDVFVPPCSRTPGDERLARGTESLRFRWERVPRRVCTFADGEVHPDSRADLRRV